MFSFYDKIGTDFILTEDGDLSLDVEGQIVLTHGTETISNALVRRLATDYSGYARYLWLGGEFLELNLTYGSDLNVLLSSPASDVMQQDVQNTIDRAAKLENRVLIDRVELESTPYSNQVAARLVYRVRPEFLGVSSDGFQEVLLPLTV
jgi:hypothetical protein